MKDANGNDVKVGDKVHYFGWHNMKPVGIVEAIVIKDSKYVAVIRPLLSKKPGDIERWSDSIAKLV